LAGHGGLPLLQRGTYFSVGWRVGIAGRRSAREAKWQAKTWTGRNLKKAARH
jgi:hypothetical protein